MARLQQLGEDVWIADGPAVSFYGMPYPTRMGVVRLDSGALWVWSPVGLDDALRAELDALGPVAFAVEPNKLHHLPLKEWTDAWPDLQVWAPPGLAKKREDVHFVGELGERPPLAWVGQIAQVVFEGSFAMTEVLFFHRKSKTCFVGDLIQKHDPEAMKSWQRWVMKADGLVGPDGSTPREWRLTFIHREQARVSLEKALQWEPERLVIAHGAIAETGGTQVLRDSLDWLL